MKNIKKMGAVFLSSVIMIGFSSLFVSAEDFNNDFGGVNYNSIEEKNKTVVPSKIKSAAFAVLFSCFCRNRLLLTERSSLLDPVLFFSRNRSLHTTCQSDCVTCYFRASKADKYPFQRSFSDHIHRRTENTGYLYNL